jgi:predicted RNA-binding protein
MCELSVYTVKAKARERVMDGVVRIVVHNEKVLIEGIFGDTMEVEGKLAEVNIIAQTADIIVE